MGSFVHLIFGLGNGVVRRFGRGRLQVGGRVPAKQEDGLDGTVIAPMEAALVDIEEAIGVIVGELAEGFDQAIDSTVFGGGCVFGCGGLEGLVEESVLDAPRALDSPLGRAHFFDESCFHSVDRLKSGEMLIERREEAFGELHVGNDGLGEESVTDGVLGGAAFAFLSDGPFG